MLQKQPSPKHLENRMNWKYIKGGEKDFVGAPEWATECVWNDKGGESFCYWLSTKLKRVSFNGPWCSVMGG